ncbi:uncharacterized protein METZ01_LOCUS482571, partial [marine metagenome]
MQAVAVGGQASEQIRTTFFISAHHSSHSESDR